MLASGIDSESVSGQRIRRSRPQRTGTSVTSDIYGRPCLFIHFTSLLRAETLLTPVSWFLAAATEPSCTHSPVHHWELAFLGWFGLD